MKWIVKHCFTHNLRVPNTRANKGVVTAKMGTKGSFCRSMRTNNVASKVVAKVTKSVDAVLLLLHMFLVVSLLQLLSLTDDVTFV